MKYAVVFTSATAIVAHALPSSASKPLLPWVGEADRRMPHECGPWGYNDEMCGSLIYCDSIESAPFQRPTDYTSTQDCLDAHEPAPTLPWIGSPGVVRPQSCQPGLISIECPVVCGMFNFYSDSLCGTKQYCEAFNKKPKPLGYKNAEACFDAHDRL
ncbi:hypothetical protein CDD83_5449 [Cordyceps sp. RAO-2017]|nr:hypothetical protein CDD83_5449 [Cordyceps sp. RAO-2017]